MLGRRFERRIQLDLLAVDEDVAENNGQKTDNTARRNRQEYQAGGFEAKVVY